MYTLFCDIMCIVENWLNVSSVVTTKISIIQFRGVVCVPRLQSKIIRLYYIILHDYVSRSTCLVELNIYVSSVCILGA